MRRHRRFVALVCVGVVSVAAVVVGSSPAMAESRQRYRVEVTVIEEPGEPPRACWGVLFSFPPQCAGGLELVDWSWSKSGVERARGTTWGEFELEGTYGGGRFRVLSATAKRDDGTRADAPGFPTSCQEPFGGWVRDAAKTGPEHSAAMWSAASASPDLAGSWVSWSGQVQVQNIAFTGDVGPRRGALEALWGGPLCVVQYAHRRADLMAIQSRISPMYPGRDVPKPSLAGRVISSGLDEPRNRIVVGVIVATRRAQERLDEQFGPGVVALDGWLTPLR